jgi:hypothetical protein
VNTEPLELTEKQLYENQGLGQEFDAKYGMKIIETNGNGSYTSLKDKVFTAIIFGLGAFIWYQTVTNSQVQKDIAVLKLACLQNPQARVP